MKIWIKYLIGIALGLASALILPFDSLQGVSILNFITEIFVRLGRKTLWLAANKNIFVLVDDF